MTLAQIAFDYLPRTPGMRRIQCRCGCGRWAYAPIHQVGRPREFLGPDCYRNHLNATRRTRRACEQSQENARC